MVGDRGLEFPRDRNELSHELGEMLKTLEVVEDLDGYKVELGQFRMVLILFQKRLEFFQQTVQNQEIVLFQERVHHAVIDLHCLLQIV